MPSICGRPLQWSACSWVISIPSRVSKDFSTAASRAMVSRLPRPASTRRRVRSVSSNVRLPELPEANMDTRKPIRNSPQPLSAANFRMMAEEEWRVNAKWLLVSAGLAGETGAVERQAVHRAQHRGRNLLRAEKFLCQRLHIFARDGFDGCQNLVERIEFAEIQLLPCQVGHARTGRLQRQHERTLEVVLGAAQLFVGNRRFFHRTKLRDGEVEHLAHGLLGGSRVNRQHSGVGIRRNLAEHRIGEAPLLTDVLE